ncbi:DUF5753 domain-containing protein [Amycolatopsis anabasis]|uniref:DUF5753 domain-containing protein n=1 Tax=Amycolatopsis anabasis TaxID=1840409 RepID=UPI00131E53C4|nr:DUF5753 domain-containing protein [Amycolatopsis anabasis]
MPGKPDRSTSPRRRELADELADARKLANLSVRDLADRMECSPNKVFRMETDAKGATEFDVTSFLLHCGASREKTLRVLNLVHETDDAYRLRTHGERLPDELRSLAVQENLANSITGFEPQLIPGILQTEDYARAVFRSAGMFAEDDIETRVRARRARQHVLHRPQPPRFTFFLHEQAVRTMVGGPSVMHEQILHLLLTGSAGRAVLRVIPESACPGGVLGGSFWLLRYIEHRPLVYVQTEAVSLFLEDPEQIAHYQKILARLAELALDGRQSPEWLATVASDLERLKNGSRWPPETPPT